MGTRPLRDASADTAKRYVEPAVRKSFWVNCGFSGLDKWRQMLVDSKDKRGWPTLFSEGARACASLQRLHESIECQSAPQAGRSLYADLRDSAAQTLAAPPLARAAATCREAGVLWASIGDIVAACDDAAVRKACALADEHLEGDDSASDVAPSSCAERWKDLQALAQGCKLSKRAAATLYADIAAVVGRIADAERAATNLLNEGVRR